METSDSENFESADEDIDSDNEKSEPTIKQHVVVKSSTSNLEKQLNELKLDNLNANNKEKNSLEVTNDNNKELIHTLERSTDEIDKLESLKAIEPLEKDDVDDEDVSSGWEDFDIDWTTETPSIRHKSSSDTQQQEQDRRHTELPAENSDKSNSWGAWGNWGVSSILNTATQSVSSLTNQVSQGLSAVMETTQQQATSSYDETTDDSEKCIEQEHLNPIGFGLGNFVSGVSHLTKLVETTGTKVITGGLDTLEAIGKKTVEVLQEGDPGLKKKRAFLKLDNGKPNLSQILREAKEKAEKEHQQQTENQEIKLKNYEAIFDSYQGLVHLEALEMVSKLCCGQLDNHNNSLSRDAFEEMQETLNQIKELCELPEINDDDDDDEANIDLDNAKTVIENAIKDIEIPLSYTKLYTTCEGNDKYFENNHSYDELHQQAIETLAQLTAFSMEQFHKAGELLLVKEHRNTVNESDGLVQITGVLKKLITAQANKFTKQIENLPNVEKENINEKITNIFYEAANSGTYIEDAFQLLIPVLQVGAIGKD